jgi:predicted RNase H-like HicB family nuclease
MAIYSYAVTIKKEGRRYYAYSDVFPGVYGLGKTIEAARRSILEAMRLYIEQCRRSHKPVPTSRHVFAETVTLVMD